MKSSHSIGRTRLARIICQVSFFAVFFVGLLRTRSSGEDSIGAVERFFHFDPLLGLTTIVASRTFQAAFGFALITIVVTALVGRYVCGWVCPLGSLLHFFSFLFAKLRWAKPRIEQAGHLRWKYLILIFVLVASVFTLDLAGFLDPLSFLYRSFSTAVLPVASNSAEAVVDVLQRAGAPFPGERWTEASQNLMIQTTFRQGAAIGLLFSGVILLNLVRPRFWCRYVCPAGALLGVLARWHPVRLKAGADKCNGCRLCTLQCPSQAGPYPDDQWRKAECFHCHNCASNCPQDEIRFPLAAPAAKSPGVGLPRRDVVLTSTIGLVAAPLLGVSGSERPSERLIRPPGALPESQFLSKCVRCGVCVKVCPTNGLQYAFAEGGMMALWTPILAPRIGYCDYYCSLCTQVCPSGAIRELTLKEKQKVRIGAAWIRKDRCLAYSVGESCRVCEQKCPTSPKAIMMADDEFSAPEGKIQIQVPVVDPSLCIGCGICENRCPVEDEPGIYCTSYGESRSERNLYQAP
ncbi:MAG: 4Fe-4S binding protein [Bryobacteraceae bacterium]